MLLTQFLKFVQQKIFLITGTQLVIVKT